MDTLTAVFLLVVAVALIAVLLMAPWASGQPRKRQPGDDSGSVDTFAAGEADEHHHDHHHHSGGDHGGGHGHDGGHGGFDGGHH
jgi:ABC-type nickel/cobalt efflux system permease component RcnA